jgi:hypothetical protein
MQNLINHIIQEEKKSWDMYLFVMDHYGKDSEPATRWKSIWNTYNMMIKEFNLTAPKKRNLSTFKHKKYTTIKTCEL